MGDGGGKVDIQIEKPVALLFVETCDKLIVGDVHMRFGIEAHVACDAAHAPHVLTFEIAAVAEADDLYGQTVSSRMDILRYLPLGRGFGVLGVAHHFAVDVEVHGRLDGSELDEGAPSSPAFRHLEVVDITAGGVEFSRGIGRIGGELVVHVGVDGHAEGLSVLVVLDFDIPRHLYVAPMGHVVPYGEKILGARLGIFGHEYLPNPVETPVERRLVIPQVSNSLLVGVRNHIRVRRHLIDAVHVHIIPILLCEKITCPAQQDAEWQ